MTNVKFSGINGGTPIAYSRATDTPIAVRNGTTDALMTGIAEQAPPPHAGGSTLAVTAAMSGQPILLDTAAGTVATLPAATGSGNVYPFFVTVSTTSNAHKILAHSVADFMQGVVTGENAGTPLAFAGNPAASHSLQMPFAGSQPSGGIHGDWFEFRDVAANLWTVKGMFQGGTTPTTPFSTATT